MWERKFRSEKWKLEVLIVHASVFVKFYGHCKVGDEGLGG